MFNKADFPFLNLYQTLLQCSVDIFFLLILFFHKWRLYNGQSIQILFKFLFFLLLFSHFPVFIFVLNVFKDVFIFYRSSKELHLSLFYPSQTFVDAGVWDISRVINLAQTASEKPRERRLLLNWRDTNVNAIKVEKLSMRKCTHTQLWLFELQLEL